MGKSSTVMKWVQAALLTLTLVFVVCFAYMFIANAGLMMNHHPPRASVSSPANTIRRGKTSGWNKSRNEEGTYNNDFQH